MSRLFGKNVLITGASSGIGHACALEFAKHGSQLILAARRTDRLSAISKEITDKYPGTKILAIGLDVTKRSYVFGEIASLPSDFSNIDILVNNAGLVIGVDHIEKVSEEAIDIMLATNVKGLLNCTQAVLPGMKSRGSGHVINISSIAGTEAYAGGGVYCATKHAVDALTRSLRFELNETQIKVTSIDPGMVETEFSIVRFGGDKGRADLVYKGVDPLKAIDIAECVAFAASRPSNVQVASMIVFATNQAAATTVFRK